MFFHLHIVENMFGDNYKKNHKEYAAEECPIARGRGLGSKRTPDILIRVKKSKPQRNKILQGSVTFTFLLITMSILNEIIGICHLVT